MEVWQRVIGRGALLEVELRDWNSILADSTVGMPLMDLYIRNCGPGL